MNWFKKIQKQAGFGDMNMDFTTLDPEQDPDLDGAEILEYIEYDIKRKKKKDYDKYNVLEEHKSKPEVLEFQGTFVGH